ncbi:MAG: S53 family peptidase [Candidatus Dormibacteraeota bacterium]|nr:S53 family peptidase [Candidatus Dormibacteraeota bacterium]
MGRTQIRFRPIYAACAAAFTVVALGGAGVQAASSSAGLVQIPGTYLPANAPVTGQLQTATMSVEVLLQPNNAAGINNLLTGQYTAGSPQYGKWLAKGQFDQDFAPTAATRSTVTGYLESKGLAVQTTASPFLIRAIGSSAQISGAFSTPLDTYRSASGTSFFSNATAVSLPKTVAPSVMGVIGLSNTVRLHSSVQVVPSAKGQSASSCETPYPSNLTQLKAIFAGGAYGYGAGPDCTGLTPSQTNSIYSAPEAGPKAQGAGATLAVFELSAYTQSDITTWAQTFYGPGYHPRLTNIKVDGGPLGSPKLCPTGDTCVYGYGGDIEVEADIEQQLAIAPDISRILVYNAPNDYTGQTELDEYTQIANDDMADSISSSWGECEIDAGQSYAEAENLIFEQMASQGQSMFSSAGDTGAFDCIRDGSGSLDQYGLQVDDPASQPWVTSVGGTSLETDNPGLNLHPSYPQGVETVWNELNLCNPHPNGLVACTTYGAGGGGHSIFWGRPAYQRGPGVNNSQTVSGPGNCSLAAPGQPCREVPDVSANADELTGYAEYCTGSTVVRTAGYGSACISISNPKAPHWFQIGGTSLSSPLWSAIFADRDAFQGYRTGNANYFLYGLYNQNVAESYSNQGDFHDITGIGQRERWNGHYFTEPGYSEATGIGTPNMTGLITGYPFYY